MRLLKLSLLASSFALAIATVARADESEDYEFDRWHVGSGVCTVLPQGGSPMRHAVGAEVTAGYYISEMLTFEASVSLVEKYAGLSAGFLWHWWGYERLDPFFVYGAKGWLDDCGAGPYAGAGAFWNLDDRWSLRFQSDATLAVGNGAWMAYSFSLGLRRTF